MIFLILGTQKFQFNRLLKLIDECITNGLINDNVIAQTGYSDYVPQNYESVSFFEKEKFNAMIAKAEMIITHAGAGIISIAAKLNKPILIFPRLKKYDEHVDDHQMEIGKVFEKEGYALCYQEGSNLLELFNRFRTESFRKYEPQGDKVIETINVFLNNIK